MGTGLQHGGSGPSASGFLWERFRWAQEGGPRQWPQPSSLHAQQSAPTPALGPPLHRSAPITPTLVRPRTESPLPDPPGPECHCPRRAEFRAGDVPLGLSQGTVRMEEPTEPQNRNSLCFCLPYADKAQFSRLVVSDSVTPWTAAQQASLSITNSWSLLKLVSMESVMPSSHLILSSPSPPAFNLSQHQGLLQ